MNDIQYISKKIVSDDLDKARFLQKSLGYAVTGDARHFNTKYK